MQSPGDNDMGKSREQRTREARAAREAARIAAELDAANAPTDAVAAPEAAPSAVEPETTTQQRQPTEPETQPAVIVRTSIIGESQPQLASGAPSAAQTYSGIQSTTGAASGIQTHTGIQPSSEIGTTEVASGTQTQTQTQPTLETQPELQSPPAPPVRLRDGTMPEVQAPPQPAVPEGKPCRHEYVRIYQRKLKGLDRRLVSTRAFLPVGFKMGDFNYLSPGSFCFCTKCRKRLFPKRTEGEKELARVERKALKEAGIADMMRARDKSIFDDELDEDLDELDFSDDLSSFVKGGAAASKDATGDDSDESLDDDKLKLDIHVDELEVESVDVEDIKAEGVKITPLEDDFDEACSLDVDEDV